MKLEILSLGEALRFEPKEETYAIRIFDSDQPTPLPELKKSNKFIFEGIYEFDDAWAEDWSEESFYGWKGSIWGRTTLFEERIAKKILEEYEKFGKDTKTIMVHCRAGANRSPAVGIAMNEIYGFGFKDLEEKFPYHRRYIRKVMLDAAKNLGIKN